MAELYSDENFPLGSVTSLRTLGHNVLTSFEAGNANKAISDKDVLAFAAANDRALLTYNRRHFIRLHFLSPDHAGIIVCSKDDDFEALAKRIHASIADNEPLPRKLLRVNLP